MHNRLLITLESFDNADSEWVRRDVYDRLLEDDSFCGKGGRFGCPLCDWFVIGGGWSGLLAETLIGEPFKAKALAIAATEGGRLDRSVAERHAAEFDALWQSLGGTGPCRYLRARQEQYGYPDDAMLITEPLYTSLLAEFEGQAGDGEYYVDLDDEPLECGFIGRKWLVVVDYRN